MKSYNTSLKIGIVGPCAAGKSTLILGLKKYGISARHIAQEHSFAPDMWQKIAHPDLLIYLDASYDTTVQRRKMDWSEADYIDQVARLLHARQNANMYLNTDNLSVKDVLQEVLDFIHSKIAAS